MLCAGGADETQGRPHQADERDPQRHQGVEALRLGDLLQGEDPGHPTEGAECAEEDGLPQRSVHHGLDQRALPGNTPLSLDLCVCVCTLKTPGLGCFRPKGWVNIGQGTCWVNLTQQIGLFI